MKTAQREQRAQHHWQTGLAQAKQQQWGRALQEFDQAAKLAPRQALYHVNRARALKALGRLDDAVAAAREALAIDPGSPLACRMAAECLTLLHRHAEAVACFAALPADVARDHDFHASHGNTLFLAGRQREAIDAFFQALALKIDSALVHYRMGLCFMDLLMKEEAGECFRTAVALDDGGIRAMALALLVHESRQACRWEHLDADTQALRDAIATGREADGQLLSPFALLAIDCTPAEQRRIGELRSRALAHGVRPLPARALAREAGRPLRVGYLTSDIFQHATAVLMAELLERRDPARIEVFMYSHSRDDGSMLRARVIAACDQFVEVSHLTQRAIAERIRADGVDILIDLKGHTRDSRYEVLAFRPAPVQATWLGYPATTGADFIDYVIGDPVVTPLAHAGDFSERIAQLPWSYQPNDRHRALPPRPARATVGLRDDAIVWCCFNQAYKISPAMLDLWARALQRVPNAVLWMLAWNPQAERNLLAELAKRGVKAGRVVFGEKRTLEGHLARLRCADLFLDTWPCNAHTTASEALWAGVPVVTVPGPTFASRVAASLLRACRLDELVCASPDDYVDTVVALSQDLPRLRAMQQRLDEERTTLPLFDSDRYARDFDDLLERMADRAARGLPPEHLAANETPSPACGRGQG
jgi:predicted O-linked N-acetylglucosamine transferase (SPINDLY family)